MKKLLFLLILGVVGTGISLYLFRTPKSTVKPSVPLSQVAAPVVSNNPKHVALIVMENKGSGTILGNSAAPYLKSLIKQGALAGNYSALTHPSLPNYLGLIGGQTFGITSDCTGCFVDGPNLAAQLDQAGVSWKAYFESMPKSCFVGDAPPYAQKHNPFIYFDGIRQSSKLCDNLVPLTNLDQDLSQEESTPHFIWITPNMCHDMHDCSVQEGDNWLSEEVPQILNSPAFQKSKSLVIITWDEAEGGEENKVPALFVGNAAKSGYISKQPYSHYSLLHTLESIWNLPPLTPQVASSGVMSDLLK